MFGWQLNQLNTLSQMITLEEQQAIASDCCTVYIAAYSGGKLIKDGSIDRGALATRVSLPVGLVEQVCSWLHISSHALDFVSLLLII